jgi:hypothetical protein
MALLVVAMGKKNGGYQPKWRGVARAVGLENPPLSLPLMSNDPLEKGRNLPFSPPSEAPFAISG